MRILANYGYKHNNETYSVTFETLGDVPKDKTSSTVDELFRMAKAAIKRQIDNTTSTQDKDKKPAIKIKDPNLPATKNQKRLIYRLCKGKNREIPENIDYLTMGQASEFIGRLKS